MLENFKLYTSSAKKPRVRCRYCLYRVYVLKNGNLATHSDDPPYRYYICTGSGQPAITATI